eukprot:CAMPEP_0175593192 /NCGR_PEP_ID=MMETSP0096-20121207/53802_1 /TAXON_ID=311494 /ORGANISM="Alexandrium monilatum, Strain CCMP3105" /LENGTH=143 /DNA_ID=CAMNT_0016897441 /DNA_START=118 /DNA_END=547 /DNA_ORIENTATION=-
MSVLRKVAYEKTHNHVHRPEDNGEDIVLRQWEHLKRQHDELIAQQQMNTRFHETTTGEFGLITPQVRNSWLTWKGFSPCVSPSIKEVLLHAIRSTKELFCAFQAGHSSKTAFGSLEATDFLLLDEVPGGPVADWVPLEGVAPG